MKELRARGITEKEDILPSKHVLEELALSQPNLTTSSNSPYVLKLGEFIGSLRDGSATLEELNDRITLLLDILRKRLENLELLAKGVTEYPEASPVAKSYAEEMRALARSSLDILVDMEDYLSEENYDPFKLQELWEKLQENDRRIAKIISNIGEQGEVNYKYCPRCGHKNPISASKCEKCGFIFSLDQKQLIDITDEPQLDLGVESQASLPKDLQYPVINGKVLTDRIVSISQLVESFIKEEIDYDAYVRGIDKHIEEIGLLFERYREYLKEKTPTVQGGLEKIKEHSQELYQNLLDIWLDVNTTIEEAVDLYIGALEYLKNIDYNVRLDELKGTFDEIFEASNKLYEVIRSIYELEKTVASIKEEEEPLEGEEMANS